MKKWKAGVIISCAVLLTATAACRGVSDPPALQQSTARLEESVAVLNAGGQDAGGQDMGGQDMSGQDEQMAQLQDENAGMRAEILEKDNQIAALQQELDSLKNPSSGVSYHGALSVIDGVLVDQYGEPIQLRGVSSHGILWYPQFGNYRSVETLRDVGANVFRIAMYTTEGRGYDMYPDEAKLTLRCTLENVLGADMYAIVDWHVLKEGNPNVFLEEAMGFFDEISSIYAQEPGVIYEICNEPNGGTSWDDIKAYANQVIPVIRKNAPDAIILVGTPNYSVKIEEAANDPLTFDNIMYTYHFYATSSQGGYDRSISYAKERGVGVFISEWGVGSRYNAQTYLQLEAISNDFLNYLDDNGISWISWALSNKDEGHSILKPDTQAWSRWSDDDLTEYGKFIFNRLGGGG